MKWRDDPRGRWAIPEIPDEIDPAPRIIRLIAVALSDSKRGHRKTDSPVGRLLRIAEILEGAVAPPGCGTKQWALRATSERRVKKPSYRALGTAEAKKGLSNKAPLTAEEKRQREQLIRAGLIPPPEDE